MFECASKKPEGCTIEGVTTVHCCYIYRLIAGYAHRRVNILVMETMAVHNQQGRSCHGYYYIHIAISGMGWVVDRSTWLETIPV